jgi:hypothetical protein
MPAVGLRTFCRNPAAVEMKDPGDSSSALKGYLISVFSGFVKIRKFAVIRGRQSFRFI